MLPRTPKGKSALKLYTEHVVRLAKQHESHPPTRLHAQDCPTRSPVMPWQNPRQAPASPTPSTRLLGAEVRSTGTDRYGVQFSFSASLQSMLARPDIYFPTRPFSEGVASFSPDGISIKPFNLDDVRGQGCTPARETRMWRTLEHIFGGWPPPSQRTSGANLNHVTGVDLAVGSSRRTLRAAGAAAAESSLVLDGITGISSSPDMLLVEKGFDFRAHKAMSRQEQQVAQEELADMGVPCYHGTSIPVGLARYAEGFDHPGIQEAYATRLSTSIQHVVANTVAQLLVAHQACGAVQGAAVVGHRFARFFVLDSAHVATDMNLDLSASQLARMGPVLSRRGRRLSSFLRHAHPGILGLSVAAYEPELGVAWDACIGDKFGVPPPDVDFGRDVEAFGSLYREAVRRVSLASDDDLPQRRLDTLVQDVIGRHREPPQLQTLRQPNEDVHPWGTIAIIRAVNCTASMVPVTPQEMDKLLSAGNWVPAAIYMSLDKLLSAESGSKSAVETMPRVVEDDAKLPAPSSARASQRPLPASSPTEEIVTPPSLPKLPSLHVASSATTDLSDFWSEDLHRDRADGEASPTEASAAAPDSAFDGDAASTTSADEIAPSEQRSLDTDSTSAADPGSWWTAISAASMPQGNTVTATTPPETTPSGETTASAEKSVPEATSAETTTSDDSTHNPTPPKAAPTLPPHLARLQALYDLEGDVVRTNEVTSKVDDAPSESGGGAPQPRATFGLRGSAGAGR